jgi:hypothetical protein
MSHAIRFLIFAGVILLVAAAIATFRQTSSSAQAQQPVATTGSAPIASFDSTINQNAQRMIEEGRRIFRYDTFGSEAFWGDQLKLQQAIVGQKLGGIGAGVSPRMALSLGLKVDAEAVPPDLAAQIKAGKVDMDSPASTVALLKANSVVGVTAFLNQDGSVRSVGIQCALCHSTVDDSFAPGIGRRLDGWAIAI